MIHYFRTAQNSHIVLTGAILISCSASSAQAQSVSQAQSLSFGPFVAGSGGTVSVNAAGARTSTGGITLLTAPQFGLARSATFNVIDPTNKEKTYTIGLPTSVTLTRIGGTETMTVDTFTSTPAAGEDRGKKGFGSLEGGIGTFTVGARLNVNPSQTGGSYSGTYAVTVTYP